jgi:hypothetical protein
MKNRTTWIGGLILLIVGLTSFGIKTWRKSKASNLDHSSRVHPIAERASKHVSHRQTQPEQGRPPPALPPKKRIASSSPPNLQDQTKHYPNLQSSNPTVRFNTYMAIAAPMDAESIATLCDLFEHLPSDSVDGLLLLEMLTYSWAQVDPEAGLEWSSELGWIMDDIGREKILDQWARYAPDDATSWAQQFRDEKGQPDEGLLVGVIKGLAAHDLESATQLLGHLSPGRDQDEAAVHVMKHIWAQGETHAFEWVERLPTEKSRNAGYRALADQVSQEDLSRAADWIDQMPESTLRKELATTVAERFVKHDPALAATWAEQLSPGDTRAGVMERIVSEWAEEDPVATAAWLDGFEASSDLDGPFAIFAHTIAPEDLETALTWSQAIQEPERRKRSIRYSESHRKK